MDLTDEEILDDVIKDGSMDIELWPDFLRRLLTRLDIIARDDFPPAPSVTTPAPAPAPATPLVNDSQATVPDHPPFSREASTLTTASSPPAARSTTSLSTTADSPLHVDDAAALAMIVQTLTTTFAAAPPHTVQRLAELLRSPRTHYTALPKFLRALERVLSVSSPATAFPLPRNPSETAAMPNGAPAGNGHAFALGSDESLGGALLTPISWLTPAGSDVDAENGIGVGVSQGELLRQEQVLEIVPANQVEGREEQVPPGIGAEDVGPQPIGTVFPDPPQTPEDIGSPPVIRGVEVAIKKDEEMMDAGDDGKKDDTGGENGCAKGSSSDDGSDKKMEDVGDGEKKNGEKKDAGKGGDKLEAHDEMQVDKKEEGGSR